MFEELYMGIAMLAFNGLLGPLQGLTDWFKVTGRVHRRSGLAQPPVSWVATGDSHSQRLQAHTPATRPAPLRVLRVVDARHGPANAGRMVISGRMADVCAELDRLADLEATGRQIRSQRQDCAPSR
jgi:hypothetical protein